MSIVDASLVRLRRLISSLPVHHELERLSRDFGWRPETVAKFDDIASVWFGNDFVPQESVYTDDSWRDMDRLLDDSWWYRERNAIITSILRRHAVRGPVWDLGGGTGVVSKHLNEHGFSAIGVEPSRAGAVLTAKRNVESFCLSLTELRLPNNSLRAVSMFDVLEHLPERTMMLREIERVLQPSGYLILTLPALRVLWSSEDEDAGHYLRYNKLTIRRELEQHGFEVVQSGYFFTLTVLPLFLLRAIPYRLGVRRALATDATLAADGGWLGRIAGRLERAIAMRTPFGSSLLVVARKPMS